jgi:hypothetical protein
MTKLDQIDQLLETWKALKENAKTKGYSDLVPQYEKGVIALESALSILKQPSNTKLNHKQAGDCRECKYHYTHRLCMLTTDSCNFTPEG